MKTLAITIFLLLSGCATCREHPVVCSIAGAIVVGSIAVSLQHDHDAAAARGMSNTQPTPCQANPAACL